VARNRKSIYLWDLDKTYLVSHFESLRGLLRVPFESGADKIAVPGAIPLIKGLHRTGRRQRSPIELHFLSASPPQIGNAVRDKLAMDGIEYNGITFKNQVHNLVRGRFNALLEQIGYKTQKLLEHARQIESGSIEYLFGDDWESDPFIYSFYADIVARRVGPELALEVLDVAGVHRQHSRAVRELLADPLPRFRVGGVFILRQRPLPEQSLDAFGRRLVWFDDYFQCALRLYAAGLLDVGGVVDVARDIGLAPSDLAVSFAAADAHRMVARGHVGSARRRLVAAGMMLPVARGGWVSRGVSNCRRALGRPSQPLTRSSELPDYIALAREWSYRGRKEASRSEDRAQLARQPETSDGDEQGATLETEDVYE
jgi:hypothetical protein